MNNRQSGGSTIRSGKLKIKDTIRRVILSMFAIACFMCAADFSGSPATEQHIDKGKLRSLAVDVVASFGDSYRDVALGVSPARLPDKLDYVLDSPLGIGLAIRLDDFKYSYCAAIPARARIIQPVPGDVRIINEVDNISRSDVYLPYKGLRDAVMSVVSDFKRSGDKNYYKFHTRIVRLAVVEVTAELKSTERAGQDAGRYASEAVFEVTFADHGGGRWRLYDIHRTDFDVSSDRIDSALDMKETLYYENCAKP